MKITKIVFLFSVLFTLSACSQATPVETITSSGTDNAKAYTLNLTESCDNQTLQFKEIAERDGAQEGGMDIGVFYDDQRNCAGVWEFDFELGALLANVRPDIDESSFALIRQEGNQIFVSALTITTGWDIASHKGGTKTTWLGVLPSIQTSAGENVEITFKNPDGDKEIALRFSFTAEMGSVTITEI